MQILCSPKKQLKAMVGPPPGGEARSTSPNSPAISCKLNCLIELASSSQNSFPVQATKSNFAQYGKILLPDD